MKSMIAVLTVLAIFASLGCLDHQKIDNSGMPNLTEFSLLGDVASVQPVYEDPFVKTIVAWKIVFKGKLFGMGRVNTRKQLSELNLSIQKANSLVATLETQGCENVVVSPFTMEVNCKIGASTVVGNASTGSYNIFGPEEIKFQPDCWMNDYCGDGVYHLYKPLDNGVIIETALYGCRPNKGDLYRVKTVVNIDGVSKKNVEELNKLLKQQNVTLSF